MSAFTFWTFWGARIDVQTSGTQKAHCIIRVFREIMCMSYVIVLCAYCVHTVCLLHAPSIFCTRRRKGTSQLSNGVSHVVLRRLKRSVAQFEQKKVKKNLNKDLSSLNSPHVNAHYTWDLHIQWLIQT